MECTNKVPVTVPSGYGYKTVDLPCGCTGPGGHQVMCEECMPLDAIIYRRYTIEEYAEDGYPSDECWFNIEFPHVVSDEAARKAVFNLLRRTCHCTHDCCGHWTGWGHVVKQIGVRTYLCRGSYSPNF